jgi:hypothetical protein
MKPVECSDSDFLLGVYTICDTAPLENGGAIYYFDDPMMGPAPGIDADDAIGELGRELFESRVLSEMNQRLMYEEARALYEYVAYQIAMSAYTGFGASSNVLIPTGLGDDVFSYMASRLAEAATEPSPASGTRVRDRDWKLLDRLLALQLPGVEAIKLREMASIRQDDSFAVFRTRVRAALEAADAEVEDEQYDAAQRLIAEHMGAALADLDIATKRGVLGDAIAGDAVGWAVGAAVAGAMAGWQAAAATLVGKGATDLVRRRPSEGRRALRSHYVALSDRRLPPPPLNAQRMSEGSIPRHWGIRSKSEKAEVANRRSKALGSLLRAIEGTDANEDGEPS